MRRLATIAAALVLLPGCSFVFVSGPPPPSPTRRSVQCSGSILAPIGDTVAAGVGGYFGYRGLFPAKDDDPMTIDQASPEKALLGIATFGVFAASAVWGYVVGRDCRQAKAAYAQDARPKRWGAQKVEEAEEEAAAQARARELAGQREVKEADAGSVPSVVPEPVSPPASPDAGAR